MDSTNPNPKAYTPTTGQSYSYKPVGISAQGNTQSVQYTPGSYTSIYNKDNNQPNSDPKSGNVLYKSQDPQISSTYTPKSYVPARDTTSYGGIGSTAGGYRANNPSADTTTVTTDNQSVSGASGTGSNQNTYKPPTIKGEANIPADVKVNYTSGGYQSRTTPSPYLNTSTPSQNQPSFTNNTINQSSIQSGEPTSSYKPYTAGNFSSNDTKPTIKQGDNSQSSVSDPKPFSSGAYQSNQVNEALRSKYPATFGDSSGYTNQRALDTKIQGEEPQIRSEGTRTYTQTKTYNPTNNNQPLTIPQQNFGSYSRNPNQPIEDKSKNYQKLDLNVLADQKIDIKPAESFRIQDDSTGPLQNKEVNRIGQDQPIFNNTLFQPDVNNREESKYPGITISDPQERKRPFGGELAKSVVDVRYELPEWYQKDKDTELYENMYMIDAVRYTNRRLVAHSPSRSTLLDGKSSQMLNRSQPSPNPNRHLEDHPNFSHKLETPRSAKKWDKHIPRVILFVSKYNSGEMEDDVDDDRFTTPRKDYEPPKHSSPYYLENHQKAYHEKPVQSQFGQRSQQLLVPQSNEGYFDYQEYRTQSVGKPSKELKTEIDPFEEDEGVRQTIRVTETRKRK